MKDKEVEKHYLEMQKDLAIFSKNNMIDDYKTVAIGYLDSSEPFKKGEVSQNFLTKLKVLWNEGSVLASAGHHTCSFCNSATSSAEKVLIDKENNIEYIFPEMIFHYIEVHKFKPCNDFIEFVMRK